MNYAHVSNGTIDSIGQPPQLTYDAGRWWDLRDRDPAKLAARGWLPVTPTARPADTDTTTYDYSVTLVDGVPTETWTARPKTQAEIDAAARAAALDTLRDNIVTQAIAWLEADADAAQTRANSVTSAVATATNRQAQAQAFVFNGASVSAINTQLNTGLKPLLVDMLTYIIGLGNLAAGTETWRGTRADPALIWLARHSTGTTD